MRNKKAHKFGWEWLSDINIHTDYEIFALVQKWLGTRGVMTEKLDVILTTSEEHDWRDHRYVAYQNPCFWRGKYSSSPQ